MFQQKWKAKQLVRGYHGDWIPEGKFKKDYLPDGLPPIVGGSHEEKVPLASMMFAEVEKRLDTVVFRCCFADSVYRARMMVVHGKVTLNGRKVSSSAHSVVMPPGTDLILALVTDSAGHRPQYPTQSGRSDLGRPLRGGHSSTTKTSGRRGRRSFCLCSLNYRLYHPGRRSSRINRSRIRRCDFGREPLLRPASSSLNTSRTQAPTLPSA